MPFASHAPGSARLNLQLDVNGVIRQHVCAEAFADFIGQHGTDHAVNVDHLMFNVNGFSFSSAGLARESARYPVPSPDRGLAPACDKIRCFQKSPSPAQNPAEIETAGFPVIDRGIGIQQVNAADHSVDGPQA